jgi:hypothetical protein
MNSIHLEMPPQRGEDPDNESSPYHYLTMTSKTWPHVLGIKDAIASSFTCFSGQLLVLLSLYQLKYTSKWPKPTWSETCLRNMTIVVKRKNEDTSTPTKDHQNPQKLCYSCRKPTCFANATPRWTTMVEECHTMVSVLYWELGHV